MMFPETALFCGISYVFVNYFLEVPFMNQQDKEWKEEQSRIDEVLMNGTSRK
jgi:DNA helicase-2/ATP-dependent DNA helicase PcrA